MASDFEIERRCTYEKKNGIVQLSPTHLVWTPDSAADGNELRISLTSIRRYQVSKVGSAKKAMIKLICSDREAPIKLDFGREFGDRDAIRDVLNRLQSQDISVLEPTGNGSSSSGGPPASVLRAAPQPPPKPTTQAERRWRELLLREREVINLHKKLVRGGAVSDETFWNGMKFKYKPNGEKRQKANRAGDEDSEMDLRIGTQKSAPVGERKGTPSDAFAAGVDKSLDTSTWSQTIPNPAQRHRVFMELPAVDRAYKSLVPKSMTEEKFWTAFLDSSMAPRRGKGARRSAATATEADTVFAEFQAQEQHRLEEDRQRRAALLSCDIDLDKFDDHRTAHILEGHGSTGDAPRPMKSQRASDLPTSTHLQIMRQVNRHGQLIVDDTSRAKRKSASAWTPDPELRGEPLEDLREPEVPQFASLAVGSIMTTAPGTNGDAQNNFIDVDGQGEIEQGFSMNNWHCNTERLRAQIDSAGSTLAHLLGRMRP